MIIKSRDFNSNVSKSVGTYLAYNDLQVIEHISFKKLAILSNC